MVVDRDNTATDWQAWQVYIFHSDLHVTLVKTSQVKPFRMDPRRWFLNLLHCFSEDSRLSPVLSELWCAVEPLSAAKRLNADTHGGTRMLNKRYIQTASLKRLVLFRRWCRFLRWDSRSGEVGPAAVCRWAREDSIGNLECFTKIYFPRPSRKELISNIFFKKGLFDKQKIKWHHKMRHSSSQHLQEELVSHLFFQPCHICLFGPGALYPTYLPPQIRRF